MKPSYSDSNGNRWTTSQIDRKSDKAARELLQEQRDELGYNVCTKCWQNDCNPLDVSHNISKKEAKEIGKTELCWDKDNMEIIGRRHHQIKDGLDLKFNT